MYEHKQHHMESEAQAATWKERNYTFEMESVEQALQCISEPQFMHSLLMVFQLYNITYG